MLIVLEGIDGAGTTSQARLLCQALEQRGIPSHLTREPTGGPIGLLLREILAGKHAPTDATTHALLFAADRADHLQREIEPMIAASKVVVSDRYYHSSLAYQGTADEREWILELNRRARRPDLVLFLEVDPAVAAKRRHLAGREDELFDADSTQRRVADGYREVVAQLSASERICVLDGERTVEEVAAECLALTLAAVGHTPAPEDLR